MIRRELPPPRPPSRVPPRSPDLAQVTWAAEPDVARHTRNGSSGAGSSARQNDQSGTPPLTQHRAASAHKAATSAELEIIRHWRGAAVGCENWVPPASAWARAAGGRGFSRGSGSGGRGGRRTVVMGVPPVVTDCLWTVRGRELDWCRSPVPGNPRCCCVRVCQSPVLIRGPGGRRAPFPSGGGCRCRRWPGA